MGPEYIFYVNELPYHSLYLLPFEPTAIPMMNRDAPRLPAGR